MVAECLTPDIAAQAPDRNGGFQIGQYTFAEGRVAEMESRAGRHARAEHASSSGSWSIPPIRRALRETTPICWTRAFVFRAGRGGQFTYSGRLRRGLCHAQPQGPQTRCQGFVRDLEQWLMEALALFGVKGERHDLLSASRAPWRARLKDHGLSVTSPLGDLPRRGIECESDWPLGGMVPCGIGPVCVSIKADLGVMVTMADVDVALKQSFEKVFG